MKTYAFLLATLIAATASLKDRIYLGCTPAAQEARSFLGISTTDSIDFIRWQLIISDNKYQVHCNYGIGKQNTNGFINGGLHVQLTGAITKSNNQFQLQNKDKSLWLQEVNANLLHLMGAKKNLLVGTSGFSYTLSSSDPQMSNQINFTAKSATLKDSMVFTGRTPCNVPGVVDPNGPCRKLKWLLVFYADRDKRDQGKYKLRGSPWYKQGGRKGNWKSVKGADGRVTFQLDDGNGKQFIQLVGLDENLMAFIDAKGNLLVGDSDFSYTLNRR